MINIKKILQKNFFWAIMESVNQLFQCPIMEKERCNMFFDLNLESHQNNSCGP